MLNYLELQRLLRNPRPLGANDVNQRNPQGGFPQWTGRALAGIAGRTQGSLRRFSEIGAAADFPESPEVGDLYEVTAAVTDPVTALDFENGDIIYWNGTTWRTLRTKISLDNPAQIKGVITVDGDFASIPVPDERIEGWVYRCPVGNPTPVTDNTVAPPQTFQPGDEFLWIGDGSTNWINLGPGSATALAYDNSGSGLVATNVQDAIDEVAGGSGGGGGIFTYPTILYVAPGATGAADDADPNTPFVTIQGAVAAIGGPPVDADDQKRRFIVLIASGSYDENVVLPAARFIELLGIGPWILGDGAGADFASTTPRNLTIQTNSDQEFVIDLDGACRPTVVVGTLVTGDTSSTHTAYAIGGIISGQVLYQATGGSGTTVELHLNHVKVVDDFDATGHLGAVNVYVYRSFFDGAFIGRSPGAAPYDATTNIIIAESTEFDGLITTFEVSRMVHCQIQGGMDYEGFVNYLPPQGLIGCDLAGTFTNNGSGNIELDTLSNYYFVANAAAAVPAAKTILHSLVP